MGRGLEFKPRLFLDTLQITNTKVFDRMSECNLSFLGRMLELVMISYTVDLYPSILQKDFHHLS